MTRLLIAVALLFSLCVAPDQQGKTEASSPQEEGRDMPTQERRSLVCEAFPVTLRWKAPQSVPVSVVITNDSEADMESKAVPAFYLKPVDVAGNGNRQAELTHFAFWDTSTGAALPVSANVTLRLRPRESLKKRVDLAKLVWSRRNYSVLPHTPLFTEVPAGEYFFYSEITSTDGSGLCSSKKVKVLIE